MRLTKDKKLDKRFKKTQVVNYWFNKYTRAALLAGIILGILFGLYLADSQNTSLDSVGETITQPVIETKAFETPCDYDPITYIRCRGEQLNMPNQDIMKMIRIARAESGFDQYAKNPNSTAKGIFQFIDGTWRANCLKDGNVYNFVDNINCAWKVYQKQGDRPWNASKSKWSK
jgi:hypothetical protein